MTDYARHKCWACQDPASGLYASHSGAHQYACDRHRGICHPACWPAEQHDRTYQAVIG